MPWHGMSNAWHQANSALLDDPATFHPDPTQSLDVDAGTAECLADARHRPWLVLDHDRQIGRHVLPLSLSLATGIRRRV